MGWRASRVARDTQSTLLASTRLHAAAGMVGLALACTEGDGVGQQISDVFLGGSEAGELLRAEPEP